MNRRATSLVCQALSALGSILLLVQSLTAETIPWAELKREYQSLGLPLPPADAPLVLWLREIEDVDDREGRAMGRPRYAAAFLLKDERPKGPARILWGTEILELRPESGAELKIVPPGELPHESVTVMNGDAVFPLNAGLPAAVQCHLRGWTALADILYRRQTEQSFGSKETVFHQPHALPGDVALRFVAWAHWGNQLHEPKSDRAAIYERMKKLSELEPGLRSAAHRDLLESLVAAIQPGKGRNGDAESLVDALVEYDGGYFGENVVIGRETPLRQLRDQAWSAMPVLIAHVDDRRLTRSVLHPWDHSATRFRCVGELVSDTLQDLAGDPARSWRRASDDRYLNRSDVADWWKKASRDSEEIYAVAHVLPADAGAKAPYNALVQRLAEKYPHRLAEVYRRLLQERPHLAAQSVVTAIAMSEVSKNEKLRLMAEGARSTSLRRQVESLDALAGLDQAEFEKHLILALKEMPPTGTAATFAECDQPDLARVCWKTANRDVWAALLAATRRSETGVRMEILERIAYANLDPDLVKRNVGDFLTAMLDDRSIRDAEESPDKYANCAASQWAKISVGDWAAHLLAERLKIDVGPYLPYRRATAEEWARLRQQVRQRWEREHPEPVPPPLPK